MAPELLDPADRVIDEGFHRHSRLPPLRTDLRGDKPQRPGAVTRTMRTVSANGHTPAIPFDPTSGVPYYTQIYNGYRTAIISGQLSPGQRLPSTRTLAEEFHVSRFPVLSAFDQLLQDGYLVGKVGSGTFVRDPSPR